MPLIVLFASRPHSSQTYETSTRFGVNAVGVALTNRIPDPQVGQLGGANKKVRTNRREGHDIILHRDHFSILTRSRPSGAFAFQPFIQVSSA
jgi:hypothetical protein